MSEPVSKSLFSFNAAAHLGVSLFFISLLSTRNVYSAGVILLLLTTLCWYPTSLRSGQSLQSQSISRGLYTILALVFANGLLIWFLHQNPSNQLDLLSRYLLLVPIFYMLSSLRLHSGVIWVCFALASLSALWIIPAQYGGPLHDGRIYGYTGAIQFGNIALSLACFCLVALLSQLSQAQRSSPILLVSFLGCLAGFLLSLLAGSRGGWIALPAVFLILAYAYLPKQYFRRGMMILSLAAALSASILWQTETIQSRIALAQHDIEQFEAGNSNTSIGARFAIWQANWKLIQERPLSGWSYQQHEQALTELVRTGQADAVVLNLANSHNNYIETWVDLGLAGLLLQILLLLYCFYGFIRRVHASEPHVRAYAACGSILIAIYALANLTQNMMERNNTLLFLLISIALFWSQIYPNQAKLRSEP
ncbi:O-antigen ligase family protein [Alcaligenes parafaecalis]|uniref:O-antigen ligase family protein n=1 Tax=Alcaligenes parafaecalis TaxID=171260 RepID=A0ABT3VL14_9BURK|nr:O-antigen ligase family protein [Alcaligenes parafaecalis]MCX5464211.1 O-antigen ligase family protein [Alcaligenes parafaecalis]